jgi:RNA polymerase sigma-B factor
MAPLTPLPTQDERDALVLRYQPLARKLAQRYARALPEREDLEQVALLGLVKAARRFDPDRGTTFATFAVPTVLGELRRYCRDTRWAVHVPRPVQERVQSLRRLEDSHRCRYGRAPTAPEAAAALRCSEEDVLEARMAATTLSPESLNAEVRSDEGTVGEAIDAIGIEDAGYEAAERRDALTQALWSLRPAAREALWLRAHVGLTTSQIAQRLGLSPSKTGHLVASATRELRAALIECDRLPADEPEAETLGLAA